MNNNQIIIDRCSLYSVYVEILVTNKTDKKEDIVISNCTGFIFLKQNNYYLVTNWHVFSGRNANTLKPLDTKNSSLPDKLRVYFPIDGEIGETEKVDFKLKDDNDTFCWLEHRSKNKVDVGLLKINFKPEYAIYPINTINESLRIKDFPVNFYVGQEVFILGYPLGIKGGGSFPIWKKGSIATEPYVVLDETQYKVLIDTATRKGMSGSPVIITNHPDCEVLFDERKQKVNNRPFTLFLGIYSGRIVGKDELSAQLGIVWKENTIREIIEEGSVYQGMA